MQTFHHTPGNIIFFDLSCKSDRSLLIFKLTGKGIEKGELFRFFDKGPLKGSEKSPIS
jgi:hypothetical protein